MDTSATETKKITVGELDLRWEETVLSPGGAATAVQFTADGSTFAGDENNFTWDDTHKALTVGTDDHTGTVGGTALNGNIVSANDSTDNDRIELGCQRSENVDATQGSRVFLARSRGTLASKLAIQDNDTIGEIFFAGWDGTDWEPAAKIACHINGTPGTNDMPGHLCFHVSADGTASPTERLTIAQDGTISFTNYSFPVADGTSGQALTTDGLGTLTWNTVTTDAGGSDTQVQFNDGGTAFGGDAGLTYNKTTDTLTAVNITMDGTITNADASHLNSERFGSGATVSGADTVAIGKSANAAYRSVCIGSTTTSTVSSGVAIGYHSNAGNKGCAVGYNADAAGIAATALGDSANAAHDYGIAIGRSSATSAANTCVIGNTTVGVDTTLTGSTSDSTRSVFTAQDFAGEDQLAVRNDGLMTHSPQWKDNVSSFYAAVGGGSNAPTFVTWLGGINAYSFSAGTEEEVHTVFHMNHDVDPGSTFHFHVHWAPDSTNTGTVRWGIEYTIQQGYSTGTFPSPSTVYIEQAASGTINYHQIAEDATGVTTADFVTDAIVVCRVFRDATHANDTFTGEAVGLMMDIHYQADKFATPNRNPAFW